MFKAIVIDDEPHVLDLNRRIIESTGEIEVIATFTKSSEALLEIPKLQADLCFVDISMPKPDGLEFSAEVQRMHLNTAIVFVTAYDHFSLEAFQYDALHYLLKPLSKKSVQDVIRKCQRINQGKQEYPLGIHTLGGLKFSDSVGNNRPIKWRSAKTEEMFALFLHQNVNGFTRDELLHTLWATVEGAQPAIVYTTIHRLKSILHSLDIKQQFTYIDGRYHLDCSTLWIDYVEFEQFAKNLLEQGLSGEQSLDRIEQYLKLYKGMLFANRDYLWCIPRRQYLHKLYVATSIHFARLCLQKMQYSRAELCLRNVLQYPSIEETAYELLLETLMLRGDRVNFISVYHEFKELLNAELGIEMSRDVTRLYDSFIIEI